MILVKLKTMRLFGTLRSVRTVVCGMSGGVDSAVSALLLKNKGYNVLGLFMKNWDEKDEFGECMADKDREDAKFVCDRLKIPFFEVNFVKEYWNEVFSTFLRDYNAGHTPNPDVLCNKFIKFNAFFNYAMDNLGADAIATGHYVRTSVGEDLESLNEEDYVYLLKAKDTYKDQTLFLSQINQRALRKSLFPVGGLLKSQVKEIARENRLDRIASRKESMGICFIGTRNFQKFISNYVEPKPGNFVHIETGEVVGQHQGVHNWTIGQRALIAGQAKALFVVSRNPETQDIMVAPGTDHPALFHTSLYTKPPHWIATPPIELLETGQFEAGFRYQHIHLSEIDCTGRLEENQGLSVSLANPMKAMVSGQFAVFYRGDVCLGSGAISCVGSSLYEQNHMERVKLIEGYT